MNGYLLIDKESDYTSFDVVAKLRGILHEKKLGHTGTLDPNATGLLVVCAGVGTKAIPLLEHHTKTYEAELLLGLSTTTEDIWGEVTEQREVNTQELSEEFIRETFASFLGNQLQTPPMYSAKKVNGKRLYDLARDGVVIERKPVPITIHEIRITSMKLPRIQFTVTCSAGTYIRTLCTDIAAKLHTIGVMSALRRTRVGDFAIEDAATLDEVSKEPEKYVKKIDSLFTEYPAYLTTPESDRFLQNGNALYISEMKRMYDTALDQSKEAQELGFNEKAGDAIIRIYFSDGRFAGLYQKKSEEDQYVPYRMMFT